jgi:WD40 repeat protein
METDRIAALSQSQHETLNAFKSTFLQVLHLLSERPDQTCPQLFNRLAVRSTASPELTRRLAAGHKSFKRPWLKIVHAFQGMDSPESMTFSEHQAEVLACRVLADGRHVVSLEEGGVLLCWNAANGVLRSRTEVGFLKSARIGRWSGLWLAGGGKNRVVLETGAGLVLVDPLAGTVQSVAPGFHLVSPDPQGENFVVADQDDALHVWNSQIGNIAKLAGGSEAKRLDCRVTADGRSIISAWKDGQMVEWDAQDGTVIREASFRNTPWQRAIIDPSGKRIAVLTSPAFQKRCFAMIDLQNLNIAFTAATIAASPDFAFNEPGDHFIYNPTDKEFHLCCSQNGQASQYIANEHELLHVEFAGGGSCLIAERGRAGTIESLFIYDLRRQRALPLLRAPYGPIWKWRLASDGSRLVTVSIYAYGNLIKPQDALVVWDLQTGQKEMTLRGHGRSVTDFAFFPDGKNLVSADYEGVLKLWTLHDQTASRLAIHDIILDAATAFSSDGKTAEAAFMTRDLLRETDREMLIRRTWEADSGQLRMNDESPHAYFNIENSFADPPYFQQRKAKLDCFFTNSFGKGQLALTIRHGDDRQEKLLMILYSIVQNRLPILLKDFRNQLVEVAAPGPDFDRPPWSVMISPDEKYIVLCMLNRLMLWEIGLNAESKLRADLSGIIGDMVSAAIAFSPDSRSFLIADLMGQVLLIHPENLKHA